MVVCQRNLQGKNRVIAMILVKNGIIMRTTQLKTCEEQNPRYKPYRN